MTTKISNPEATLWFLLAVLEPNIHKALEERLLETAKKLDQAELADYVDLANDLMDANDECPRELLEFLLETFLSSDPSTDKILDANRLQLLAPDFGQPLLRKLDKFYSKCLKGPVND